jgi:hypothetical protein
MNLYDETDLPPGIIMSMGDQMNVNLPFDRATGGVVDTIGGWGIRWCTTVFDGLFSPVVDRRALVAELTGTAHCEFFGGKTLDDFSVCIMNSVGCRQSDAQREDATELHISQAKPSTNMA